MKFSTLLIIPAIVAAFGGLQAEGFGKPYVHKPRTDMPHCDSPSRKPGSSCYRNKWDVQEDFVGASARTKYPHCDSPAHKAIPGSKCYRNIYKTYDVQEDSVGATPPAKRCKPFYSNIRCPSGSVKKFVLNSAQPWCDRIPVCYVAEPVPYARSNRLRRKYVQLDEEDDEYVGWKYPSPPSKPGNWRI
jgi:hypothetical protein